jgi:hypothetical protein
MDKPKLLSEPEVEQIRIAIREGFRGPVTYKCLEQLLADHDERMRLAAQGTGRPEWRLPDSSRPKTGRPRWRPRSVPSSCSVEPGRPDLESHIAGVGD